MNQIGELVTLKFPSDLFSTPHTKYTNILVFDFSDCDIVSFSMAFGCFDSILHLK